MGYICGEDRMQIQLYTTTLEDMLGEDNPVRVIDAFVDNLNMAELEIERARPGSHRKAALRPKGSA